MPATSTPEPAEGWTWLMNSTKWHYFRGGRSLCGRFLLLAPGELEKGNDQSPDNCKACATKRAKETAMETEKETADGTGTGDH